MNYIFIAIASVFITLLILAGISPKPNNDNNPAPVTRESIITYTLDEKVKVKASSDWYDGRISGITTEDKYLVDFCGPFGWAGKNECRTDEKLRSELAKTKQ